jgi:hypothetical protein
LNERGAKQGRAEQLVCGEQHEVYEDSEMAPGVNLELGTGARNAEVAGNNRARGGAAGAGSSWLAWLTHHLTH